MDTLRKVLLQISVICSFVCMITKVLDWYNPYMDFSGHIWYIQICLYIVVIFLALMTKYGKPSHIKRRNKNNKQFERDFAQIIKNK